MYYGELPFLASPVKWSDGDMGAFFLLPEIVTALVVKSREASLDFVFPCSGMYQFYNPNQHHLCCMKST